MEPLLAHADLLMPTDYFLATLCYLLREFQASEFFELTSGRCRVLPGIFLIDFEQYPINLTFYLDILVFSRV
jgi:hypothetical protein